MAKIMDPILPILSILGYRAIILGSVAGPGRSIPIKLAIIRSTQLHEPDLEMHVLLGREQPSALVESARRPRKGSEVSVTSHQNPLALRSAGRLHSMLAAYKHTSTITYSLWSLLSALHPFQRWQPSKLEPLALTNFWGTPISIQQALWVSQVAGRCAQSGQGLSERLRGNQLLWLLHTHFASMETPRLEKKLLGA